MTIQELLAMPTPDILSRCPHMGFNGPYTMAGQPYRAFRCALMGRLLGHAAGADSPVGLHRGGIFINDATCLLRCTVHQHVGEPGFDAESEPYIAERTKHKRRSDVVVGHRPEWALNRAAWWSHEEAVRRYGARVDRAEFEAALIEAAERGLSEAEALRLHGKYAPPEIAEA